MLGEILESLARRPGQPPSIGRIVHYCLDTLAGKTIRPAIVTAVDPKTGFIELSVFTGGGGHIDVLTRVDVKQCVMKKGEELVSEVTDEAFLVGTWRWPPRV
jgi:hypothetical protein